MVGRSRGARLLLPLLLSLVPAPAMAMAPPVVTGSAQLPGGEPAAGATAELFVWATADESGRRRLAGQGDGEPVASTEIDAAGRYRLPAPAAGIYRVRLWGAGRLALQYLPLVLVANAELPPAELLPARELTGRAVEPGRGPLSGTWVFARDPEESRSLQAGSPWRTDFRRSRTGPDGTFSIPVAAGEEIEVTLLPAAGSELAATAVRGFTGGEIAASALGARRTLRVVDEKGEPVPDALVRLGRLAWPVGTTDATGRVSVMVSPEAPTPLVVVSTRDGRGVRTELPPPADEEAVAQVKLPAARTVRGRVVDAAGRPLAGALVYSDSDPGAFRTTGPDGLYALVLPAGDGARVQAEAPGHVPRRITIPPARLATGRAPTLGLEPAVSVAGRVVDRAGEPVAGVHLAALPDPAGSPRPFLLTDPADDRDLSGAPAGHFLLDRLQPGEPYTLVAFRSGGPAVRASLVAPAAGAPRPEVTVTLQPAGSAEGRVVDLEGRPVGGAEVRLAATGIPTRRLGLGDDEDDEVGDPFAAVTEDDGRFRVAAVPAPSVDVGLRARGFAEMTVRGVEVASVSRPAPPDAPDFYLGTFVLVPGGALHGLVVDPDDEPIPGAEVHVLDETFGQRVARLGPEALRLGRRRPATHTGPDGRFVVEDLPRGARRYLWVHAPGRLPANAAAVEVPTEEPVRIVLRPAGTLVGRVVDAAGEPVAGTRLSLGWRSDGVGRRRGFRRAESEDDGSFRIGGLPPGTAVLSAEADGFADPEPVEVEVPPEGESEEVVVALARGATVTGNVTTVSGRPVAQVRVLVGGAQGVSDADGIYRLDGARHGTAKAKASHPRYGRFTREVEVEPGVNTLDWELPDGSRVAGVVVDERGEPVAGAAVALERLDDEEPWHHAALSQAEGGFTIEPVPAGLYGLSVEHPDHAPTRRETPVEVADDPVEGVEVILTRGTTVHGHVLGLAFDELAEVRVEARGPAGALQRGEVDYEGAYELAHLPPGSWLVTAATAGRRREAQVRVTAAPGIERAERDLEFGGGVELQGTILLDGEPLPSATVDLAGEESTVHRTTATDHRGEFRLADLEPGSYRFSVTHPAEAVAHGEVLEIDADRRVSVDLRPSGVSGRVTEEGSGRPLADALVALERLSPGAGMLTAGTGPDGRFTIPRVAEGDYRLTIRKDGWAAEQTRIEVPAGSGVSDLEIELAPTDGLALEVALASGGVPTVLDLLLSPPGRAPILAERRRVGADGRVDLPNVGAGTWTLAVSAPGGALIRLTVEVPGEPVRVALPAGGRLRLSVAGLTESTRIATATLWDGAGRPLETLDLAERRVARSWPLPGGTGTIDGVPAGRWTVIVQASDGRTWSGVVPTSGGAASLTLE